MSGRLGGDFPSFYAAGQVLVDDADALYDPSVQAAEQRDLFGEEPDGGQLFFAYPPPAAVPYAALAHLPYRLSYVVHTLVMASLLVLGLHLVRPLAPLVDRYFEQVVVASLLFYPMFVGVTGGQNTALTFALVALFLRALSEDRELLAGVALAGLLFKPQFALPLVALALIARRVRSVGVAAAGGLAFYLIGASLQGWGWIGPWVDTVRWLDEVDTPFNVHNAVSWLGLSEAVFGVDTVVAAVLGWGLAGLTAAFLAWRWWVAGRQQLAPWIPALMPITAAGLILVVPHVIYYDAGLLVLALAVLAAPVETDAPHRAALAVLLLVAVTQVWSSEIGVAPVGAVVIAVFAWAVWADGGAWSGGRRDALDSYVAHPDVGPSPKRS